MQTKERVIPQNGQGIPKSICVMQKEGKPAMRPLCGIGKSTEAAITAIARIVACLDFIIENPGRESVVEVRCRQHLCQV